MLPEVVCGMDELRKIGFSEIGRWANGPTGLEFTLARHKEASPALYAFVVDDQVMYVGKTKRTLYQRMSNYLRGSGTQVTNIRVRAEITRALDEGRQVVILGFVDDNPQRLGPFKLNLAAALEDDIIDHLNPPWNGGPGRVRLEATAPESTIEPAAGETGTASTAIPPLASYAALPPFRVQIGKTYFHQGFFNVPVSHSNVLGSDGSGISIVNDSSGLDVLGKINRSVNPNNTPRIMGGQILRKWLQANVPLGGYISVRVRSPQEIIIEVA